MRWRCGFLRLAIAAILAYAPGVAASDRVAGPVAAEVIRVVDGDTVMVRAHVWLGEFIDTAVRLEGVDAPELHGVCDQERSKAAEARDYVSRLLADGPVRLVDIHPDKYGGRIRARVLTATGADLSAALLEAGLARPYHGHRRQAWCD